MLPQLLRWEAFPFPNDTAIVLGHYVYIDGGEVSQLPDSLNPVGPDPVNSTLSIDISKSWLTSTVEIKATSKANDGPVPLSDQALRADPSGNAFYVIGGPHICI